MNFPSTNRFRGSAYDVMRNSDWNSNSWVNKINGTPKAVDKQSDWGYTFGGPIGKPGANNKLFFFYAHEYRPRNAANTLRQFRVPTQAERNGDFSASLDNNGAPIPALKDPINGGTFPGNKIPQDRLYQTGLNILKMYPLPSLTQAPGTSYNLEFLSPTFKTLSQQPAPGVSEVSDAKLRLVPIGRFSTSAVVTRKERWPLCDWIMGASDLTVTVSDVPPTDS